MLKISKSPINWSYINIDEIAFCQSYIDMNRDLMEKLIHYINNNLMNVFNGDAQKQIYDKLLIEHPLTDIDWWKNFYPQVKINTTIILKSGYEIKLNEYTSTVIINILEKSVEKRVKNE